MSGPQGGNFDSTAVPPAVEDGGRDADVDVDAVADVDLETDGSGEPRAHTVRLELVDEPGQLLAALEPIAEHGGNLLSVFHERGNRTPRGHIPVEVDLECHPDRFEAIVESIRDRGVTVIQAGEEQYGEALTVVLVGDVVDTDLSDTLQQIESSPVVSVEDLSLSAPAGTGDVSSARLRLATRAGERDRALARLREVADEKGLSLVEPLEAGR